DRPVGGEDPENAAALGVERIDLAVGAPEKEPAAHHRRLRIGPRHLAEAEGPFEPQFRHVGGDEPGHPRRLGAMLGEIDAPAIPMRRCEGIAGDRRRLATTRYRCGGALWATEEAAHCLDLRRA